MHFDSGAVVRPRKRRGGLLGVLAAAAAQAHCDRHPAAVGHHGRLPSHRPGLCRHLKRLFINNFSLKQCDLDSFIYVLSRKGALPAIQELALFFDDSVATHAVLSALSDGALPSLRYLKLDSACNIRDLAGMVDKRARNITCCYLLRLDAPLIHACRCARFHLVLALLRTPTPLPEKLVWNVVYDHLFQRRGAPHQTRLEAVVGGAANTPSVEALEKCPALASLYYWRTNATCGPLYHITEALSRDVGLHRLNRIHLNGFCTGRDFFDALAGATCAARMKSFSFDHCLIAEEGIIALSIHLGRDSFPALDTLSFKKLYLDVACLAQGLLNSSQTRLGELGLSD